MEGNATKKRKEKMKGKISTKYNQLVEKCNSLHVSTSCVVQLINFS